MSELMHYGTPRHSGRYPWGSGKNPQRSKNFKSKVDELKRKGLTESQIAKGFGMSVDHLRARVSISSNEINKENVDRANRLKEKGYSNVKIGEIMGHPESTIRAWLKPGARDKRDATLNVADELMKQVDNKGYIDVGRGAELSLNTTDTKLKTAIAIAEEKGYKKINVQVDQLGTASGQKTTISVLAPPGTTYRDVVANMDKIKPIDDGSPDAIAKEISKLGLPPVNSISSDRIKVVYAEQHGTDKDGVIELRRGLEDLNLGEARYAQVRIGVDGTHYLKGMAMYSDKVPEGFDVIFNTNKHEGTPLEKVLKPMKDDPDNPFGASIKKEGDLSRVPRYFTDKDGNVHVSPINVVNEEGDWGKWSKTLASQMLSKQPLQLAKKQLDLTYSIKKSEFDEIMSLTNPVVKRKLLESFADDCDASAVHLKAAALPRQAAHVILPISSLKDNEIYAPHYNSGEMVALIRFPHAGTFEIPVLKVNNSNKEADSLIRNARDAVGINSSVAERLSGADFDGDTVLVIPTGGAVKIKSTPQLEGLKDFDPKEKYKIDRSDPIQDKIPKIKPQTKQTEMGKVSNLITDMTIKGASPEELARAVRHSMVVIDSEKHDLDYRRSARENGIDELKQIYQERDDGGYGGASTLISRAKSETRVPRRKELAPDPETGEKRYEYKKGDTYLDKKGNVVTRTQTSTQMGETKDATTLISVNNTPIEREYARYANQMKDLGNEARKEYMALGRELPRRSPTAAKTYAKEVSELNSALNVALKNAPKERQAQLIANTVVSAKRKANPDMTNEELKKIKGQALATARIRTGAQKQLIEFTDRQWEAVQNNAISPTKLSKILNNSNMDDVRKRATPRQIKGMSNAQIALAKSMHARGYELTEIADRFGVSPSTISNNI